MDLLIQTKLLPPSPTAPTVERGRVLDQLQQTFDRHAVLVVAPAGYGKTELLAQWYRRCATKDLRVGWISLEQEDGEIEAFLLYALAALGESALPSGSSGGMSRRAAVARLLGATLTDARRCVLFLDDYDRTGGRLDELVRALIERTSPRLQLVMASRAAPAIGLAELRSKGEILEVGPDELRMGFLEAQALMAHGAPPASLTAGDIALLLQRTEGWPIALRMASDYIRSHPDAAVPLTGFSGRAFELANYLYEAVLRTLPADEQQVLMRMACLPRICGELVNALTDRRDGGAMLHALSRSNVLMSRLDDEGQWYRIHPLLAEFLVQQLVRADAQALGQMQHRAALWFERERLMAEALQIAAAVGDRTVLAGILDRAGGWRLCLDGRIALLRSHLGLIPDSVLLRHPRLALARALLLVKSAAALSAGMWLERVRQASHDFSDARDSQSDEFDAPRLALEAEVVRVGVARYLDEVGGLGFAEELQQLRERVDAHADPHMAGMLDNLIAYEMHCLRRHQAADAAAALALRHLSGAGLDYNALMVEFIRCGTAIERGRIEEAQRQLFEVHRRAEDRFGLGGDLAAASDMLLARVLALQGDAAGAREHLDRSLSQVEERDAWFDTLWDGYSALVASAWLAGDGNAALAALNRAQALAERRGQVRLAARVQLHRIDILLRLRQPGQAADLAATLDVAAVAARFAATDRRVGDAALLTQARLALADGRCVEALTIIEPALARWSAEGSALMTIEALILATQARRGESSGAAATFDRALALAVPAGLLLPFLEDGEALGPVIESAIVRSGGRGAPNLRARFLAQIADALPRLRSGAAATPHAQGLSSREAQVAALLIQGLSNKLIARELQVSESTVKFHLRNLYDKLGAHTRADVAQRLRDA